MANPLFPTTARWLAIGIAVAVAGSEARAERCPPASPSCHLEAGKQLLERDPRRAAEELLASYQLDERTDTLALYATALELDRRYALALETWKRVIIFRDSELETAKETARTATGRKLTAARTAAARAEKQSEQAAQAILKLWPRVARVRIRLAPGQQLAVSHDGADVDPSRDVLVNAGRDELVFTRKDGTVERVAIEVPAGALAKIDAPSEAEVSAAPGKAEPTRTANAEAAAPPARPGRSGSANVEASATRAAKAEVSATPGKAEQSRTANAESPRSTSVEASAKPASSGPTRTPKAAASAIPARPEHATQANSKTPVEIATTAEAREPRLPVKAKPSSAAKAAEPPETELEAVRFVERPRSPTMTYVGLGLTAGAVVAGGVAGTFGLLANRDYDQAGALGCASNRCPVGPAADLAQRSNDRARVAQITAITGGALLATGVTLWLVGRGKTRHAVTDLALHVGPASTAISGRF